MVTIKTLASGQTIQQTFTAVLRIRKALDVAVKSHDVETVRGLLHALIPYTMTEDLLRNTGLFLRVPRMRIVILIMVIILIIIIIIMIIIIMLRMISIIIFAGWVVMIMTATAIPSFFFFTVT